MLCLYMADKSPFSRSVFNLYFKFPAFITMTQAFLIGQEYGSVDNFKALVLTGVLPRKYKTSKFV